MKEFVRYIYGRLYEIASDKKLTEIVHGSFYSLLAKFGVKSLGIITSIISARYYGAEMLGVLTIIVTTMGIANMMATMGMQASLLKLVPQHIEKYCVASGRRVFRKIHNMVMVSTVAIIIVMYLLSDYIADDVFDNHHLNYLIPLSILFLVFKTKMSINISMIRALKMFKTFAAIEFAPKVFSLVLLLVLTFGYYDPYNIIYIMLATTAVTSIACSIILIDRDKKTNKPDVASNKEILALSLPMFLTGGLQLVIVQTDNIMIEIFRSTSELGIYSVVFSLAMLINYVLNSVNVMSAPKFAELHASNNLDDLHYVAAKSTMLLFWVSLPIALFFIVFGYFILGIYGEEFVTGYIALVLLVIGQFITSIVGPTGFFLSMTGHHVLFKNIMIRAALLNVLLNYFLIPLYGISGAAFASMCSAIYWNISSAISIKNIFGFHITYVPFFSGLQKKM